MYKLVTPEGKVAMYSRNKERLERMQADWAVQYPDRKFEVREAN